MFVAVTNDGGFYHVDREEDAVYLADIFEIDFNDWAFNVFEVDGTSVYFTGIAFIHHHLL